ncbi:MAG: protein translocase subunit SecD [Candidatus Moranbacteria bacterium CG23_combo_of_CG06-09_8_20_14_all_39_10]|nr:MAG: protein translocase subunit SecD [Candidatus Moranbacteria bacterium CG23_combo_of_CG06-09_8_20_14_all_39_10]
MTLNQKLNIKFTLVIILALVVGLISYPRAVAKIPPVYNAFNKLKINLGLDLQGGIHLEYKADTSKIDSAKIDSAMQGVQDAAERRVNAFGVAEPVIYTTKSGNDRRLIIELAGVKDINEAKKMIGNMPFLEFKEEGPADTSKDIPQDMLDKLNAQAKQKAEDLLKKALAGGDFAQLAKDNSEDPSNKDEGGDLDFVTKGLFVPEFDKVLFEENLKDGEVYKELVETQFGWHIIKKIEQKGGGDALEVHAAHILLAKKSNPEPQPTFVPTGLTGKNLKNASVGFDNQGLSNPKIDLEFDSEGADLFAEITKKNIGKSLPVFLDGNMLTSPTIQSEITGGKAEITGTFTNEEANNLVKRLNEGALPVPIREVDSQSVEASLGQASLEKSIKAGIIGLAVVIIFMLAYYRFLGLIAVVALLIYMGLMISIFRLSGLTPWQITLTLPGIAGFILSIGMAVDANILIFERTKEEIRRGRNILGALDEGFKRAWTSIRDGNFSSIITAFILIELGTGFVKGFAVTLIVGVLLSMFTAVTISRTLLKFILDEWISNKLWLVGVKKQDVKK